MCLSSISVLSSAAPRAPIPLPVSSAAVSAIAAAVAAVGIVIPSMNERDCDHALMIRSKGAVAALGPCHAIAGLGGHAAGGRGVGGGFLPIAAVATAAVSATAATAIAATATTAVASAAASATLSWRGRRDGDGPAEHLGFATHEKADARVRFRRHRFGTRRARKIGDGCTHLLLVKLLDRLVPSFFGLEVHKAEAARAAAIAVARDVRRQDRVLLELGEEGLVRNLPSEATDEGLRSCVKAKRARVC